MEETIPGRLLALAKAHPEWPAYHVRTGGEWIATSFGGYLANVRQAARAMIALGFEAGEHVCVLGFNRPEWVAFHVGCMAAGGAPAGIYTTSSPSEVSYIASHSEARFLLLENRAQWDRLQSVLLPIHSLQRVILMSGEPVAGEDRLLSWKSFLALGDAIPEARVDERVAAIDATAMATLIYTSGTTGPPKGVMLSHANLAFVSKTACRILEVTHADRMLSYLPLSHIAEQAFTILGPAFSGYSIYFAEALEKVPTNLKEAQPTIFFGVPRIWEKLHAAIAGRLSSASALKKMLFAWASRIGRRVSSLRDHGEVPGGWLALQHALAKRLVYAKVRSAVGLGEAKLCVSGSAPISRQVLEFFAGLDINLYEVYGQSEGSGPTSFNLPGHARFGTVGLPLPEVEVQIADDGEILVRGPNVFLGYYKDPAATGATLEDGWLRSGDLGTLDAEGYLRITGRKKEIIITAGGKNITPVNIEAAIKQLPIIEEAVVIGDARPYLTALVTLNIEAAKKLVSDEGGSESPALHESPIVRAAIESRIVEVNQDLSRVETIKKFCVLQRSFSIETGELTPSLKIKRRVVEKIYGAEIERMYRDGATAAS